MFFWPLVVVAIWKMSLRPKGAVINSDKITRNFSGNINWVSWQSFAWVRWALKSALIDVPWASLPLPRFGTVYLHTSRSLPAIVKFLMWVSSFWHPASRILGDERAELTKKFKTIWICSAIKRRLCFLGCRIIAATVPDKWSQGWSRLGHKIHWVS